MGSGLIVSVAYMDPGNWGTNISGGEMFNYDLLWIIWLSSIMAMLFQYISGKIGIAGYNLVELIKNSTDKKILVYIYWFLVEVAILATDLAEFFGIVIALDLLFNIPYIFGTFLAVFDVLIFFVLTSKRFRIVEFSYIIFVSIIGLAFLYELLLVKPVNSLVVIHSFSPTLNNETILLIGRIVGATVMPHALLIHSWLTKNKISEMADDFKDPTDKRQILSYHKFDNFVSLLFAGFINAAMLIMAAAAFYGKSFDVQTLTDAYKILQPLFGAAAAVIFAIALLSAGLSSSITGTLSGQAIMDGLTEIHIKPWVRRVVTRFINIIPLTMAILLGINPLEILVVSQVILSLLIPLPLIPIIYYSSKTGVMKEITNRKITTVVASVFGLVIIVLNIYLLVDVALSLTR